VVANSPYFIFANNKPLLRLPGGLESQDQPEDVEFYPAKVLAALPTFGCPQSASGSNETGAPGSTWFRMQ
jgi:hypothetical protein